MGALVIAGAGFGIGRATTADPEQPNRTLAMQSCKAAQAYLGKFLADMGLVILGSEALEAAANRCADALVGGADVCEMNQDTPVGMLARYAAVWIRSGGDDDSGGRETLCA